MLYLKDAVSFTEDSEVQDGAEKNEAISPLGKRPLRISEKDLNVQTSSTKKKLVEVKVEK